MQQGRVESAFLFFYDRQRTGGLAITPTATWPTWLGLRFTEASLYSSWPVAGSTLVSSKYPPRKPHSPHTPFETV
jgi:hypothetical protein